MIQKYKWTTIHWQEVMAAVDCVVSHVDFSLRTNTEHTFIFPLVNCPGSSYPHDITLSVSPVLGIQKHATSSLVLLLKFWGIKNNRAWHTVQNTGGNLKHLPIITKELLIWSCVFKGMVYRRLLLRETLEQR